MAEKTKLDANYTIKKSMGMGTIRVIAYVVLVLLSVMCLIWFYLLFINATRAHSEITSRISFIPGDDLIDNLKKLFTSTLDFPRGILNSAFVAFASSILTVYFSMMTAFAVHAYNFKGKKAVHVFILAIMMIPTQVTSLGFYRLVVDTLNLKDSFIPLIVPSIMSPITYFYIVQYMKSIYQNYVLCLYIEYSQSNSEAYMRKNRQHFRYSKSMKMDHSEKDRGNDNHYSLRNEITLLTHKNAPEDGFFDYGSHYPDS